MLLQVTGRCSLEGSPCAAVGTGAPGDPGYKKWTGTAIALPVSEHHAIPNLRGEYNGSIEDLVKRDLQNLRTMTDAPASAIDRLQQLVNERYFNGGC